MSEPIIPFSAGLAWAAWDLCNCDNCAKGHVCINADGERVKEGHEWVRYLCDIEQALDNAYWQDGTISSDIAGRMGPMDERCREFVEAGER